MNLLWRKDDLKLLKIIEICKNGEIWRKSDFHKVIKNEC